MYFHPFLSKKEQRAAYRETVKLLINWLASVFDKLPAGCTPVIFSDVNDGIGQKLVGGTVQVVPNNVVAPHAARREKLNGGAGESVRISYGTHGISSANSWLDSRPTFFGNQGNDALLDHVFLPSMLISAMRSGGPPHEHGKKVAAEQE